MNSKEEKHQKIQKALLKKIGRPLTNELFFGSILSESPTKIKRKINEISKFNDELTTLCNRYGINLCEAKLIADPDWGNDTLDKNTGVLSDSIAVRFFLIFNESKENISTLNEKLQNKNLHPSKGAKRIPLSFIEYVLIGLELYSYSNDAMEWFRAFIEPEGGLEKKLRQKGIKVTDFIVARHGRDIKNWRSAIKQLFERSLISNQIGKDIKATSPYEKELAQIRSDIKAKANEVLASLEK